MVLPLMAIVWVFLPLTFLYFYVILHPSHLSKILMKQGNFLKAAVLASAVATGSGCSVDEDCSLPTTDGQDKVLSYTVLGESQCVNSIADACRQKAIVVCAASYDDYTSGVERMDLACSDTGGIEEMCSDYDVLMCNATNNPDASTLICNGEER